MRMVNKKMRTILGFTCLPVVGITAKDRRFSCRPQFDGGPALVDDMIGELAGKRGVLSAEVR